MEQGRARPDAVPQSRAAPAPPEQRLHRQSTGTTGPTASYQSCVGCGQRRCSRVARQVRCRLRLAEELLRGSLIRPGRIERVGGGPQTHGMARVEVRSAPTAAAHLGHVFDDGPAADRRAFLHQLGRRSTSRPRLEQDRRRCPARSTPHSRRACQRLLLDFLPIILFFGACQVRRKPSRGMEPLRFATRQPRLASSPGGRGRHRGGARAARHDVVVIIATRCCRVGPVPAAARPQGRPDAVDQPGPGGRAGRPADCGFPANLGPGTGSTPGAQLWLETEVSAPRQNVGLFYDIPLDPPLTDKLRFAGGYQNEEIADMTA